ncbi:thiol-activated cytolysin family protein [Winogradskyella sp.]|uniref:thiol-activated cytolysin family protein n=1 Tax=Winogradskyella sp. TaxID=1883156 RepID=UPI002604AC25|nr:thiol-activated cytolysin family protein [Winogradskyella sp.]
MKTNKFYRAIALALITVFSCSKEEVGSVPDTNPDAQSIIEYINGLNYNQQELLNEQDTGFEPSRREVISSQEDPNPPVDEGQVLTCTTTNYDLFSNFENIAILRPNLSSVYPGALVIGDGQMLFGTPTPLAVNRAPATLRVDLPGIGDQGTIVVENPAANSEFGAKLDEALEWWNTNNMEYPDGEGYVNEAGSTYDSATLFSSTQLGLDVGLNLAWADNSVASQLQFDSTSETRVATMVFKQVFYDVVMDTPSDVSAVFRNDVTLEQVQSLIDNQRPPAYVSSVSYGRIIMLRLETTYDETNTSLDAALEYAAGVDVNATIDTDKSDILKTSSIKILTLGGNAEVAASSLNLVYEDDEDISPGVLNDIIIGENAVYSRNNPGVPISYTIRYLKDNTLAKMGYNEQYTAVECARTDYEHKQIKIYNDFEVRNMRFRYYYDYNEADEEIHFDSGWITITDESQQFFNIPDGAWNVEYDLEYFGTLGVGGWEPFAADAPGYVSSTICYRGYNPSGWGNGDIALCTSCSTNPVNACDNYPD